MKTQFLWPLFAVLIAVFFLFAPAEGQNAAQDAEMQRLIATIQQQTTTLKANQETLETRLAALAEEIRQARIFTSRSGRGAAQ